MPAQRTALLLSPVCAANSPSKGIVNWSEGYYSELENRSGADGKFVYYFESNGWGPDKLFK